MRAIQYSIIRAYDPTLGIGQPSAQITVPEGCNRVTVIANTTGLTSQVVRPVYQDVDAGTGITLLAHLAAAQTVTTNAHGYWEALQIPRGRGTISAELGASVGAGTVDVACWFWSEG